MLVFPEDVLPSAPGADQVDITGSQIGNGNGNTVFITGSID